MLQLVLLRMPSSTTLQLPSILLMLWGYGVGVRRDRGKLRCSIPDALGRNELLLHYRHLEGGGVEIDRRRGYGSKNEIARRSRSCTEENKNKAKQSRHASQS